MKKQQDKKDSLIKMTLALTLITVVSALILGYTYEITKKPIAEAENRAELAAIEAVIGTDYDNNPYQDKMLIPTKHGKEKLELYPARKNGKITSFAMKTFSNQGFGGKIELIVGFNIDGRILNYQILSSKETPGLGSKVSENKFKSQFKGLVARTSSFKVTKDGGDIDGVTAATISSRAVIDAINRAYGAYKKLNRGENKNEQKH